MSSDKGWPKPFSGLNLAEMCGAARELSREHYICSREALKGTAYHEACEVGNWDGPAAMKLTPEELADVKKLAPPDLDKWLRPAVGEKWEREKRVGVLADLTVTGYEDPKAAARGICDLVRVSDGCVYVADMKSFARHTDPLSMQMAVPAIAIATSSGLRSIRCALWDATRAVWISSPVLSLESDEVMRVRGRFMRALQSRTDRYVTGAHCVEMCYARDKCPAYMLPSSFSETALAPLHDGSLSPDNAMDVVLAVKALRDAARKAHECMTDYVRRTGAIDLGGGREYRMVHGRGRRTVDQGRLRSEHPDVYEAVLRDGRPYSYPDIVRKRRK